MINVSNEFKELMSERQDFKEYAEVTLANGTVLELTEDDFSIDNNSLVDSAGANSIPLGVALSRNVQLEIMNDDDHLSDYDFFGAKIRLYLTFELSSTTEKIEYGTFTVTQPETYGSVVTIVGYDDMYKADKTYSTTLTFPATAKSVLIDSCDTCGILIGDSNFLHNDFQIPTMPSSEYTHRQIIGFIAMIACGNARIDRTGHLQIMTYDFDYDSGNVHTLTDYNTLTNDTNDVQVTGAQMTKTVTKTTTDEDGNENEEDVEELVKYGSDGYVLEIENPLVAGHEETLVSWIYERFKDVTFRGFTMDYISYPIAEFGDKIKVTDWKGKSFYSVLTDVNFVFFGYTTLQNSAESPMRNQSNYTSSEQKALIQGKELVEREKTNRENAIKKLNETLKSGSGLYSTEEKQPDGSSIYYLHDKRSLAESRNVIKLTSDAIGFSTDGGKTYPYGFTITGEMITRLLYAEGINADYINTGAITVRDSTENIIFQVDMDTGKVVISGDNISIGGKKLTEEIEDIKKAGNLILKMDNEYQGVSVDHDGNYVKFPKVTFTVQTFWGQTDVTKDTSFSFAKSDGVNGTFDTSSKVYTVSSLTTDTGWIDVTATYMTYTAKKRFNIAKIRDGSPGRVYLLEPSINILKKAQDGSTTPDEMTFKAYYRDGTNSAKVEYQGIFVVEESKDGKTWTKTYESSSVESSLTYSFYNCLEVKTGDYLTTNAGSMIVVSKRSMKDVLYIRCRLYTADKKTVLDEESIPLVMDVEALTHEQIFNLLTNNGAIKGIYKEGEQLYISFTYAKGGELALGGKNNGNGVFKMYDENNNVIGTWDKDGINATKGTFSGELKAASGTFTGKLEGVTGTFSGELKAATGTFTGICSNVVAPYTASLNNGWVEILRNGQRTAHMSGRVIYKNAYGMGLFGRSIIALGSPVLGVTDYIEGGGYTVSVGQTGSINVVTGLNDDFTKAYISTLTFEKGLMVTALKS
ncbi:hypothetical protein [Anaerostipes sp. Marseille-Q3525]|uniref:hypothetical protein n=1 Tax=Anaerostipes sp. Marseille-Q3525 TaxID=2758418 RepID=UPI001BAD7558|nr:hypothetical protein [Anaerostipes sp. Marseille-Q3525]MBR9960800.1 hypothetical protein [Anaerostipes sp. Marseille-Q3525]